MNRREEIDLTLLITRKEKTADLLVVRRPTLFWLSLYESTAVSAPVNPTTAGLQNIYI